MSDGFLLSRSRPSWRTLLPVTSRSVTASRDPIGAPVTACAAGVQAIGDAARLIRAGESDIAICGGTEACMNAVSLGGFAAARALSTGFNGMPTSASRPFDAARDGFVMGEGAGLLVIEALAVAGAQD